MDADELEVPCDHAAAPVPEANGPHFRIIIRRPRSPPPRKNFYTVYDDFFLVGHLLGDPRLVCSIAALAEKLGRSTSSVRNRLNAMQCPGFDAHRYFRSIIRMLDHPINFRMELPTGPNGRYRLHACSPERLREQKAAVFRACPELEREVATKRRPMTSRPIHDRDVQDMD